MNCNGDGQNCGWCEWRKYSVASSSVFTLEVYLLFNLFFLSHNDEPVTKPQSTTQDVIGRRGRTCPRNESLHILWRKRKVLHHHLSWHHRWWNCDWLRLVGDSDVDVCYRIKMWHAVTRLRQSVAGYDVPIAARYLWNMKLIMKISPQCKKNITITQKYENNQKTLKISNTRKKT